MGRQTNIDSILALENRIQETATELIQLKRSRNSLLDVARIPPEILGYIFHLKITPAVGFRFPSLHKGSYNFLLVCHHWFEVAHHTPELWSFWGNNVRDWKRRHLRSGTSPLDLVLSGARRQVEPFDGALRDALRDRAAHDTIRTIHLRSPEKDLLAAIVSALTPKDEGVRHSSVESIALGDVDVSDFFARYRFPKLRDLDLSGRFRISSWDCLTSSPMALVSLSLHSDGTASPKPALSTSQVLSLLALNPNIRYLVLDSLSITDDGRDISTVRVILRHLERLILGGEPHHVLAILRQLELPEKLDDAKVTFKGCTLEEVREAVGPYIRDYLHRDPRFKDRLGLFLSSTTDCISLEVDVISDGYRDSNRLPQHDPPYTKFTATLSEDASPDVRDELCGGILALLPQDRVVCFETNLLNPKDVLAAMTNIEVLHLIDAVVLRGFLLPEPDGPNTLEKLLPSLRRLYLEDPEVEDEDWGPLIVYLAHQTSDNQDVSLAVFGEGVHICSGLVEQVDELVKNFDYQPDPDEHCPFDVCP